jgi:hypothetical protein
MNEREFIKAISAAISKAATPAQAALDTYEVCCKAAESWGMNPLIEVGIKKPGEPRHFDDDSCYAVVFEAGPYEWAVAASLNVDTSSKVLAEPYYSFDLCFTEA